MRLWALHPIEVWERLRTEGELRVDPAHPRAWQAYPEAYEWMRGQMRLRLVSYGGGRPWWAWRQWSEGRSKPDLRALRHFYSGPWVRLEFDLPESEVLLSSMRAFEAVMSKTLLLDSAEAGELWEASGMPEHSVAAVEASWAKVFAQEGEAWIGDLNQACFETLRMRDVREATPFHGLGKAG